MNIEELNEMERELELQETVEIIKIAEAAKREEQDTSQQFPTGFADFDSCTKGGFREGDFTIVAGVPGEGKTTLMREFTLKFYEREIPTMWFSYEMTKSELWDSFKEMGATEEITSYVPVDTESDLDWIKRHIQKGVEEDGVRAVFIDTLGDVSVNKQRKKDAPNHATLIEMMCKDLRDFGVKNKLMIFAAAHCTKTTRSKSNETDNSDIANSNGIPATATNIFHVWRDNESDHHSFIKIGKSRRDGSKKGWKFRFDFQNNRLVPEGHHEEYEGESAWRQT